MCSKIETKKSIGWFQIGNLIQVFDWCFNGPYNNKSYDSNRIYFEDKKIVASDESSLEDSRNQSEWVVSFPYPISYKLLVNMQKFDGSWNDEILEFCGVTEATVLKFTPVNVKKKWGKLQQLVVMYTWMGINRLKTIYKEDEDEWKLIAKKAESYLANQSAFKGTYTDIKCNIFDKDDEKYFGRLTSLSN